MKLDYEPRTFRNIQEKVQVTLSVMQKCPVILSRLISSRYLLPDSILTPGPVRCLVAAGMGSPYLSLRPMWLPELIEYAACIACLNQYSLTFVLLHALQGTSIQGAMSSSSHSPIFSLW